MTVVQNNATTTEGWVQFLASVSDPRDAIAVVNAARALARRPDDPLARLYLDLILAEGIYGELALDAFNAVVAAERRRIGA